MPVLGVCEGAQPLIGFNFGAQNYRRVVNIFLLTSGVATLIMSVSWVFLRFFSGNVAAMFDPNDAELIRVGGQALKTMTLMIPIIGIQFASTVFLQATKFPRMAAFLALCRQLLFLIPCLIILPKFFGLPGVFYAMPTSDFLATVLCGVVMWKQLKKYKALIHKQECEQTV